MHILNASPQGGQASTSAVLVAATPMSHDNGSPEYEVIQDMGRRRGPRHEAQHPEGNDEPQSSHTSHDAQPPGAVPTRYSITQCSAYGTAIQDQGQSHKVQHPEGSHEVQHPEGSHEPQSSRSDDAQPSGAVLTEYSITQCSAYGTAIQDQGPSHQVQHPEGSHEHQSSRSDDAQPPGAVLTGYGITQCSAYGTTA